MRNASPIHDRPLGAVLGLGLFVLCGTLAVTWPASSDASIRLLAGLHAGAAAIALGRFLAARHRARRSLPALLVDAHERPPAPGRPLELHARIGRAATSGGVLTATLKLTAIRADAQGRQTREVLWRESVYARPDNVRKETIVRFHPPATLPGSGRRDGGRRHRWSCLLHLPRPDLARDFEIELFDAPFADRTGPRTVGRDAPVSIAARIRAMDDGIDRVVARRVSRPDRPLGRPPGLEPTPSGVGPGTWELSDDRAWRRGACRRAAALVAYAASIVAIVHVSDMDGNGRALALAGAVLAVGAGGVLLWRALTTTRLTFEGGRLVAATYRAGRRTDARSVAVTDVIGLQVRPSHGSWASPDMPERCRHDLLARIEGDAGCVLARDVRGAEATWRLHDEVHAAIVAASTASEALSATPALLRAA